MRKLLVIGLLILAAAIGGAFLGRNLTGLGPIPDRSAFAGRLPGVMDGNQRRFEFFYATNRVNSEESFKGYGNLLGDKILTGTYDVLISPNLSINPFVWFEKDQVTWGGHKELTSDSFPAKLKESVQLSPHKSVLVVIWGFRDWFRSAALKTAYTAYTLDINTPVLLFDWPGNQGDGAHAYLAARKISKLSAPDFGRTLAKVIRETGAENIWVMGSSLGCETICDSLTWLTTQPDLVRGKPKLAHIVLSAPDVSSDAFDETFAAKIQTFSRHMTAYVSSNDRALLMSQWLNGGRRLGRKAAASLPPAERTEEYEFEEAAELLDLNAKNIDVVDATPINRLRNLHHFFTDSPEFFDDLYQRLLQPDDIVSRRLHEIRTGPDGRSYYILWGY